MPVASGFIDRELCWDCIDSKNNIPGHNRVRYFIERYGDTYRKALEGLVEISSSCGEESTLLAMNDTTDGARRRATIICAERESGGQMIPSASGAGSGVTECLRLALANYLGRWESTWRENCIIG